MIDVAPTLLEAARPPEPKVVNGVEQIPMQGTSMLALFMKRSSIDSTRFSAAS